MNQLTVIIVSYNSAAIMEMCQKELLESGRYPLVVIDNASPDGSASRLAAAFPNLQVLALEQNIGYGSAANIGLRQAETPYALLLNPDLIVTPEDVDVLLRYAMDDSAHTAIWGPATTLTDSSDDVPQAVKWISGSAMLFDVEKIRDVGLFDENIFLFAEETDLCERTLRKGYSIRLCRDIFFDHLAGQASPADPAIEYMKWWHFGWSQCYLLVKNDHSTFFRNPRRKRFVYLLYSIISLSRTKRLKWKAKADGADAFIRGDKAFDASGHPLMYPYINSDFQERTALYKSQV